MFEVKLRGMVGLHIEMDGVPSMFVCDGLLTACCAFADDTIVHFLDTDAKSAEEKADLFKSGDKVEVRGVITKASDYNELYVKVKEIFRYK